MVEIIVVIFIMALLSAIAVPVFSKWSSSIRYREAALGIASELKLGRDTAVTANTEARVEFDVDGRRFRITQGNLPAGSTSWTAIKTWEALYAELDWATGSGCGGTADMNILFRPNGSSGGGVVCIKDGSGVERFRVLVSSISGRVRVE